MELLILVIQTKQRLSISGGSVLQFNGVGGNVSSIATISNAPIRGLPQVAVFALSSETGAIAVSSTPATWFRIPYPWRIIGVRASLYTAGSTATTINIFSVAQGVAVPTSATGTSIFSTALTIDATRTSSIGSATNAVLTTAANTTGLADDSGLSVFITSAGTSATGLKLLIYYTQF